MRLATAGEYAAFATGDSESLREKVLSSLKPATPEEREKLIQEIPLGSIEMRRAFGRDGEYGRWLRQLPVTVRRLPRVPTLAGGVTDTRGA